MEIKINALIPQDDLNNIRWVEVFGYATKGQPGLEINGLNSRGKIMREKIIYLGRKRKVKFPLKRFILSVEGTLNEKSEIEYLELPLLLCLWSLADVLSLSRLDNCFSWGKVSLEGEIFSFPLKGEAWSLLHQNLESRGKKAIYLGQEIHPFQTSSHLKSISPLAILNDSVGGFFMREESLQLMKNFS